MKSTWIHDSSPLEHTTTRNPGESDADWARRHVAELYAIWTAPVGALPPDNGTSVTTVWTSGGEGQQFSVVTAFAGLRATADAHLTALLAALELAPAD